MSGSMDCVGGWGGVGGVCVCGVCVCACACACACVGWGRRGRLCVWGIGTQGVHNRY